MENTFKINSKTIVSYQDIIYLRASGNYTTYYMKNGKFLLVAKTIKKIEARLKVANIFYRTHKAFLVNLNHVIDYQEYRLILTDNLIADLSRRKKMGLIIQKNTI